MIVWVRVHVGTLVTICVRHYLATDSVFSDCTSVSSELSQAHYKQTAPENVFSDIHKYCHREICMVNWVC